MVIVDVLVLLILLTAIVSGALRGVLASIGTFAGLIGGGTAAYWLAPLASAAVPWPMWRAVIVVAGSIVLLAVGAWLGSAVGKALRRGAERIKLRVVDRLLGGVAGLAIAALAVSLVGSGVTATGIPTVSSAVASSRVLGMIESLTPAPLSAAFAQLRGTVLAEGLPQLGILLGSGVGAPPTSPPVSLDDPSLAVAAASVARISGTAYACGISLTGTGFVISAGRIVTNAHVVAGVVRPVVELPGRQAREGRIVYFDPIGDLAVIAVDGLDAPPLGLADPLGAGSTAVAVGYPFGGPVTQTPARVLSAGTVAVADIYSEASAPRRVYALAAQIQPGDSGGPLLTAAGTVAGVVFARAQDDKSRGYAMTDDELAPVIARSETMGAPVSSGRCTR